MRHPTAIIDTSAKIPASCTIGPYCVIGAEVELGEDCELISHVTIHGPTKIGSHNRFFPFCAVGIEPQDVSYRGEKTRLEMGDHNVIRECVTINRGTVKGGGVTRVGSHTRSMAYASVGLERRGFTKERIKKIHHAFRVLLNSKLNTTQALEKLKSEGDHGDDVAMLVRFIEESERGVIK